jgi:hypothetical protein
MEHTELWLLNPKDTNLSWTLRIRSYDAPIAGRCGPMRVMWRIYGNADTVTACFSFEGEKSVSSQQECVRRNHGYYNMLWLAITFELPTDQS